MEDTTKENDVHNIDGILTEIRFGKFQLLNYLFIILAVIVTTMNSTAFVFSARDTSYRCLINECETLPSEFEQKWLANALPYGNNIPEKCLRFPASNSTFNGNTGDSCKLTSFDNSTTVRCKNWIYGEGHTIVKDFNIPCEDWKRSLVGTINGAGQLVSLLFSGYLSDRYGRRNVMIIMTSACGVLGLIQSFSQNYWFFLVFEFLNLAASAGAYAATYVLGVETLSTKTRVYGSATMNLSSVIASLLLGFFAWLTPSWRPLLIISNVPAFLTLFAFCVIPESFRWLNTKGKKIECAKILRKAAQLNGVTLKRENTMEIEKMEVLKNSDSIYNDTIETIKLTKEQRRVSLRDIIKAPQLLNRLVICAFCWFTNVFVYYGLSLNSVNISGDEKDVYLNFILSALVEIPGLITYPLILRWMGRKYALLSTLFLSGVACLVYAITPNIKGTLGLIIYLISKLFIAVSFAIVYVFTTEIFPTSIRNSTMNICSVFGRIGGALAPQVPLLNKIHPSLPMITYGIVPVISAFTLLKLPESRDKDLPDTVEEAEHMK